MSESRDVRRCRICCCIESNRAWCIQRLGEPCHWVDDDLCSACVHVEATLATVLHGILHVFGKGMRLTIVARHPEYPEAGLVISNEERLELVIKKLHQQLRTRPFPSRSIEVDPIRDLIKEDESHGR